MVKKLLSRKILTLGLAWAAYLTLTMVLFESLGITPAVVPFGILGWMLIVELPRVWVGFLIMGRVLKLKA